MSSLYTLTAMAAIRYNSVVRSERSWHFEIQAAFWTSRYVQLIWVFALILALPPLVGVGRYVPDGGMIRQECVFAYIIISLLNTQYFTGNIIFQCSLQYLFGFEIYKQSGQKCLVNILFAAVLLTGLELMCLSCSITGF